MMQEGFVKVFANIQNFKRDCPLEFWVRRIMINTALKQLRQKSLMTVSHETEEVGNIASEGVNLTGYSMDELLGMIQSLAPRYRMVFNLYAIEGYSHKEIGEMLEITEGTSKSQLSKARTMLQRRLQNQESTVNIRIIIVEINFYPH